MKDQHEQIKGYRDLSQKEIDIMNEAKDAEKSLIPLFDKVFDLTLDPRQARDLALAKTKIEEGFIFLVRAVANPDGGLRAWNRR